MCQASILEVLKLISVTENFHVIQMEYSIECLWNIQNKTNPYTMALKYIRDKTNFLETWIFKMRCIILLYAS